MARVLWSEFATENLRQIYQYHKKKANERVASKIKRMIFDATRQLAQHPDSGQIEFWLEKLNEGHRYIVTGHYKIVYRKVIEGVLITDVFDTRQNPMSINDIKRKPIR